MEKLQRIFGSDNTVALAKMQLEEQAAEDEDNPVALEEMQLEEQATEDDDNPPPPQPFEYDDDPRPAGVYLGDYGPAIFLGKRSNPTTTSSNRSPMLRRNESPAIMGFRRALMEMQLEQAFSPGRRRGCNGSTTAKL